jgi:hypothetical protein
MTIILKFAPWAIIAALLIHINWNNIHNAIPPAPEAPEDVVLTIEETEEPEKTILHLACEQYDKDIAAAFERFTLNTAAVRAKYPNVKVAPIKVKKEN